MRPNRPPMLRTLLVPVLVLVLVVGAFASITALHSRAHASADAQLKLARTENALNALQAAPFFSNPTLGGSPAVGRGLLDRGMREIDQTVAELSRTSPPPAVLLLAAPLKENYATLEDIYNTSITTGFDDETELLAAKILGQAQAITKTIRIADSAYEKRSETADSRATIGSAAVLLLLVACFALLYRRSVRARMIAEQLVVENGRLLDASRVEALTDALTSLPNRRALVRDLEETFDAAGDTPDRVLALLDLDGFKLYNDTFGHPAGDALLTRLGGRLSLTASESQTTAYRMGGDEFCVLGPAGSDGGTALLHRAAEALSEAGGAFDIGCSFGLARIPDEADTAEDALRLADRRMYVHKVGQATPSRQSTDVLLTVLSERNPNLRNHLSDVAALAEEVARAHGLAELDVQWIRIAAELHDVGKVAIPDAILNKPGPLTDAEWAFMKRHTEIGERIIRSAESLAPAAQLVRSSHERYDGKGYPDGLSPEATDVGASIIAICDAYDAMVNQRVYRDPMSHAAALAELSRCAGTQFDPAIVKLFCSTIARRGEQLESADM